MQPQTVPELLDEISRLHKENDHLRAQVALGTSGEVAVLRGQVNHLKELIEDNNHALANAQKRQDDAVASVTAAFERRIAFDQQHIRRLKRVCKKLLAMAVET